jgi:hypothetical protein
MLFGTVFLAVLLLGPGNNVFAQQPATPTVAPAGCVPVIDGDNLWVLSGHKLDLAALAAKNPDLNPQLDSPKRQFATRYKQLGVHLALGECIYGVVRHGRDLVPAPVVKTASVTPPPPLPDPPAPASNGSDSVAWRLFGFLLIVAAIIVGGLIFWGRSLLKTLARESAEVEVGEAELTAEADRRVARAVANTHNLYDPYTGPPVVSGGLPPHAAGAINEVLLREAYGELPVSRYIPYDTATIARLIYRIGPIEYGLMNGHVRVRGAAANSYVPKILGNQPGYRTTVHLPDDTEQVVYSLAACCNPVRIGNWMEAADDFTFTPMPGGAAIVAPAPAVPEPVIPEIPIAEFTTPGGGRVVVYGPGSVVAVPTEGTLTVTISEAALAAELDSQEVAAQQPEAEEAPVA